MRGGTDALLETAEAGLSDRAAKERLAAALHAMELGACTETGEVPLAFAADVPDSTKASTSSRISG